jgi:DNA repair protein RecN (Recombination protein N)
MLIDIHGQHAHQSLLHADVQRQLLDEYGGLEEEVGQVSESYRVWQALHKARVAFESNAAAFAAERAQLEEQARELQALAFTPEAWRELQDEHKRLAHAASLLEGASATYDALAEGEGAVLAQAAALVARLRALLEYDSALDEVVALLESADVQLQEAAHALRRYRDRLDLDPQRLQDIDARLDGVHRAARKYRVSAEALPALLNDAQQRLSELGAVGSVDELRQKEDTAQRDYAKLADKLSGERRRVAKELSAKVTDSLQGMAMSGARFEVALTPLPAPGAHGYEQIEFQVSSHQGLPLGAIGKIASGGELSRISLAIQVVLANVAAVPTLIFDEVDAGIGGKVAEIVGRMLKQLGKDRQVLCVTHLPQVAACADHQFSVAKRESKGVVTSSITALDRPARIEEIARMLGGVKITDTTRQHAAELLSGSSKARK